MRDEGVVLETTGGRSCAGLRGLGVASPGREGYLYVGPPSGSGNRAENVKARGVSAPGPGDSTLRVAKRAKERVAAAGSAWETGGRESC